MDRFGSLQTAGSLTPLQTTPRCHKAHDIATGVQRRRFCKTTDEVVSPRVLPPSVQRPDARSNHVVVFLPVKRCRRHFAAVFTFNRTRSSSFWF
ncbi:uncharacterized protein V6R79_006225 [Siganus canaliculatus]